MTKQREYDHPPIGKILIHKTRDNSLVVELHYYYSKLMQPKRIMSIEVDNPSVLLEVFDEALPTNWGRGLLLAYQDVPSPRNSLFRISANHVQALRSCMPTSGDILPMLIDRDLGDYEWTCKDTELVKQFIAELGAVSVSHPIDFYNTISLTYRYAIVYDMDSCRIFKELVRGCRASNYQLELGHLAILISGAKKIPGILGQCTQKVDHLTTEQMARLGNWGASMRDALNYNHSKMVAAVTLAVHMIKAGIPLSNHSLFSLLNKEHYQRLRSYVSDNGGEVDLKNSEAVAYCCFMLCPQWYDNISPELLIPLLSA